MTLLMEIGVRLVFSSELAIVHEVAIHVTVLALAPEVLHAQTPTLSSGGRAPACHPTQA